MKNWYVFFGLQLNFHGNKPSMTLLVATCPIVSHDSSTPFFSAIINSPLSLLIPGFSTTPSRINSSSSLSFLPVQCHSHPLNASQSQKINPSYEGFQWRQGEDSRILGSRPAIGSHKSSSPTFKHKDKIIIKIKNNVNTNRKVINILAKFQNFGPARFDINSKV